MKVQIDDQRCVGHGMCLLAASDIFSLSDEDGHAIVLSADVPPDRVEAVHQAQRGCPEQAIIVIEE